MDKSFDIDRAMATFGFTLKEKEIYLTLLEYNQLTVLELSRKMDIKRPTLYRLLEQMTKKGFVEIKIDDKRTFYTAVDPIRLESIIIEKEEQLSDMKSSYKGFIGILDSLKAARSKESKVVFYRGKRGMEQAIIQEYRFEGSEVYALGVEKWYEVVGNKFAEMIRERIVEKKIKVFELKNDKIFEPTPPTLDTDWTTNKEYLFRHYYHRAISEKKLKINQDLVIYGDTIHFYGFKKREVFIIEIEDAELANMMKQMFIILWNSALKKDSFGGKRI